MAKITISLDPGLVNSAVVVLDYKKRKVIKQQMVPVAITKLTKEENDEQYPKFVKYWDRLFKKYKPTKFICERFQNRGFRGGQSICECVNVMLGTMQHIAYTQKIDVTFPTAATWKNKVNRSFSLEKLYDKGKEYKVPPHKIDSLCMNLYLNEYDFGKFKNKNEQMFWIRQLMD